MKTEELLELALKQAQKISKSQTWPNPRVGAALKTKSGKIFSAAHEKAGSAHAEVLVCQQALREGENLEGAILAVTLEPCSHQGKTPPCADFIIGEKISTLIYGSVDSSKKVNGQGLEKLREAGVEVIGPLRAQECFDLNREWLTAHNQGFPFIKIKMATSLDGLWTAENKSSQWITCEKARANGRALRAETQVLVTGGGTIRADNPQMTARDETGKLLAFQPKVFVLSCSGVPLKLDSFGVSQHPGGAYAFAPDDLKSFFQNLLGNQDITDVLVEAGPTLTQKLLDLKLFNEIHLYLGTKILGGAGLRLGHAFGGGALPGLDLKLQSFQVLSEHSLKLILVPAK